VQLQPLVPTTVVCTRGRISTTSTAHHDHHINNNGDSFKEKNKVEDDIKEKIFGGIFMEGDEKEKLCLNAIYVDFFEYLFLEESRVTYCKENSMASFLQLGVSDVGRNLLIFSMKTKNREDVKNNIEVEPFD
jgi:hypothetical protein